MFSHGSNGKAYVIYNEFNFGLQKKVQNIFPSFPVMAAFASRIAGAKNWNHGQKYQET